MKSELIGSVKLIYDHYLGKDLYSDGDIEDEMLKIAQTYDDVSMAVKDYDKWPILYHFSKQRENIISWIDFKKGSDILEVGAGCGAITGGFPAECNITCVELSKKRSMINAFRHKNSQNIEIIVGNFNEIKFDKKYDYITLIGVLEYAKMYTEGSNAGISFLSKIKSLLKADGKIIIAIENKFGLKYFAGAAEDHTNRPFDGIEGYATTSNIETYSKKELTHTLIGSGFSEIKFYYPMPDYKIPKVIYSDDYLPKSADYSMLASNSYTDNGIYLFNEFEALNNIFKSEMFDVFSNSFLVIAS